MPRKKPVRYTIPDLLSEYNEALYEEVAAQIPVELLPQPGTWSAHISESNIAIIGYSRSVHPDACFAHELLHIKAELAGMRDPYVQSEDPSVTAPTLRFLINQLAHHKIYPEFYDLGFDAKEFLHDSDYEQARHTLRRDVPLIESVHRQSGELLDGFAVLFPYLVCVSPNETSSDMQAFKARIVLVTKPEFIQKVDTILSDWVSSPSLDYCLPLAQLLKACHKMDVRLAPANDLTKVITSFSA